MISMQSNLPSDPDSQVPMKGQRYIDSSGKHWRVADVIHSNVLDGFFIARLGFGATPECSEDSWVLGRSEFHVLCRERGLRLAASDEAASNVFHLPAASHHDERRSA